MKHLFTYLFTLLIYSLLDLAFINLFAKDFIQKQVGGLLAPKADLVAAVIFYLIFIAGILYFCVYPAFEQKSSLKALMSGAFLGLLTYGTYELVNKSLLANWTTAMVIVDIIWGIFVGAAVSISSFFFLNWMSR